MHPFIWDLHPSATCVINLTLLCTAGIKLYEDQPARSSPIQMNSLLYIPLTSVTLPPRKYQSQDMHIAGRPWLQTVIIKSTGFLLKTPDRLAGRRNWSEHQTVNIIVRNKRENDERCISASSRYKHWRLSVIDRRFVPCSWAHSPSQCRHATLTILPADGQDTHTHTTQQRTATDCKLLQVYCGQNPLCLQPPQSYTDIDNVMLHTDRHKQHPGLDWLVLLQKEQCYGGKGEKGEIRLRVRVRQKGGRKRSV